MAYSLPAIAVTGAIIAASWGNDVRGSIAETAAARAATAGRGFRITGANALEEAGGMFLIAKIALSANAASIDFDNIPAAYDHLKLMASLRSTDNVKRTIIRVRFNGDTGARYDYSFHTTDNNSSYNETAADDEWRAADIPGASAASGVFGDVEIMIPFYRHPNRRRTFRSFGHAYSDRSSVIGRVYQTWRSGYWRSAAAINRILIYPPSDKLASGSVAALYGISA